MLEHLMEPNSEELTSSAAASHAPTTVLLGAVKGLVNLLVNGNSGPNLSASFAKLGPDGLWVKTCQGYYQPTLEGFSDESLVIWKRWGTSSGGVAMEHPTLGRFTVEIGSSSLPTPTSSEHKYRLQGDSQQSNCLEAKARRGELLPTPQAWDAKDYHAAKPEIVKTREQQKARGGGCANLAERMAATGDCYAGMGNAHAMTPPYLPTPAASQMGKPIRPLAPSEADGSHGTMLVGAIGQEIGESGESPQRLGLNPEFVEVMMNFPVGWTELTD
jgi:hypothetical protein